jgi:hypothetical protein
MVVPSCLATPLDAAVFAASKHCVKLLIQVYTQPLSTD